MHLEGNNCALLRLPLFTIFILKDYPLHIEIVYVSVIHCIIKWCIFVLALDSTNNADPESGSSLFASVPVYWYPEKNVLKSLNCLCVSP